MQGVERKNLRAAYISKPEIQDGIEMPLDVNVLFATTGGSLIWDKRLGAFVPQFQTQINFCSATTFWNFLPYNAVLGSIL